MHPWWNTKIQSYARKTEEGEEEGGRKGERERERERERESVAVQRRVIQALLHEQHEDFPPHKETWICTCGSREQVCSQPRIRAERIQGSRFLVFTFLPFHHRPSPPHRFKFTRLTRMEGGRRVVGKITR